MNIESNEELRDLRKHEYMKTLERTKLRNVRNTISSNDTILDIYDLNNKKYGVLQNI